MGAPAKWMIYPHQRSTIRIGYPVILVT